MKVRTMKCVMFLLDEVYSLLLEAILKVASRTVNRCNGEFLRCASVLYFYET